MRRAMCTTARPTRTCAARACSEVVLGVRRQRRALERARREAAVACCCEAAERRQLLAVCQRLAYPQCGTRRLRLLGLLWCHGGPLMVPRDGAPRWLRVQLQLRGWWTADCSWVHAAGQPGTGGVAGPHPCVKGRGPPAPRGACNVAFSCV